MVAARRRTLESGAFSPVADALEALALETLGTGPGRAAGAGHAPRLALDAGCGEGWYTDRLRLALDPLALPVLGIDVSRPAIRAAARRHPAVGWAVASNRAPPVLAGAAPLVTSLFGFEAWEPWAALQAPGQHVLTAGAGPDHLVELRRLVYGTVRVRDAPRDGAPERAGYALVDERRVRAVRAAASGIAADALAMTPHAHRVPAARAALVAEALPEVDALTLDVTLRVWRRAA